MFTHSAIEVKREDGVTFKVVSFKIDYVVGFLQYKIDYVVGFLQDKIPSTRSMP